ncbi:type I-B CRISPR-associated protein Cas7/Csh2 [Halalkalicoccus salilacus]|uniref:type I-B CRISPR-associated protein Cas7/Csh2 n=1 Tax=Halalkalicoccus salilacus TaxID=3117459 RepID=UPI00300F66E0
MSQTDTPDADDCGTDLERRSEIVFVTDAQDCNPNGNPKGENRPRIDPVTQQCVVTDVRLKRYLRDQLNADGHGVFVKTMGDASSRAALALDRLRDVEEIDEPEDLDEIEDIHQEFLDRASDVRYFGATLSFNKDPEDDLHAAVKERFEGANYTGPVQFSPARSLNAVETNEEYDTLTSVIATQEEKTTGGYGLDDNRIKYGIFPFHGVVDENGAANTRLSAMDVERLDTLCWRALKNQTISRSKFGQEPRLYVRVEYDTDGYHVGDLHHGVSLDTDRSKPDEELRTVNDVYLDVSDLTERLRNHSEHIHAVHVVGNERLRITDGETVLGTAADFPAHLEADLDVHSVNVYEEFGETLPNNDGTA